MKNFILLLLAIFMLSACENEGYFPQSETYTGLIDRASLDEGLEIYAEAFVGEWSLEYTDFDSTRFRRMEIYVFDNGQFYYQELYADYQTPSDDPETLDWMYHSMYGGQWFYNQLTNNFVCGTMNYAYGWGNINIIFEYDLITATLTEVSDQMPLDKTASSPSVEEYYTRIISGWYRYYYYTEDIDTTLYFSNRDLDGDGYDDLPDQILAANMRLYERHRIYPDGTSHYFSEKMLRYDWDNDGYDEYIYFDNEHDISIYLTWTYDDITNTITFSDESGIIDTLIFKEDLIPDDYVPGDGSAFRPGFYDPNDPERYFDN